MVKFGLQHRSLSKGLGVVAVYWMRAYIVIVLYPFH